MGREELKQYLYDYIILRKNISSFEQNKSRKLQEITNNKTAKIKQLNNTFNDFTQKNLHSNTLKAEKVSNKIRQKIQTPPVKFRVYWLGVLLVRLVVSNGLRFRSFFTDFWLHFWISLGVALVIFVLRTPLLKLLQVVVNILLGVYIKSAERLDISTAKSKGITNENVAEVYNYPTLYDDIDKSYTTVYDNVKNWNLDYYNSQCNNARELEKYIPNQVCTVGYLSYMYEQLYIGAADDWKEAVNLLNQQIKHAETTGYLKTLSQELEKSTQKLTQLDNKIDRAFDSLSQDVAQSCNQINSRIDGLFEGYYY